MIPPCRRTDKNNVIAGNIAVIFECRHDIVFMLFFGNAVSGFLIIVRIGLCRFNFEHITANLALNKFCKMFRIAAP